MGKERGKESRWREKEVGEERLRRGKKGKRRREKRNCRWEGGQRKWREKMDDGDDEEQLLKGVWRENPCGELPELLVDVQPTESVFMFASPTAKQSCCVLIIQY